MNNTQYIRCWSLRKLLREIKTCEDKNWVSVLEKELDRRQREVVTMLYITAKMERYYASQNWKRRGYYPWP